MSKLSLGVQKVAARPADVAVLDEAERMLAEAVSLPEIRAVMTFAETARQLARKAHLGLDAQNRAAGISLEAQAKADEAINAARDRGEVAKHGQGRPEKDGHGSPFLTLDDLDISGHEAAAWAQVRKVAPERRRAYVAEATVANEEASRAGLLKWQPGAVMSSLTPEWYTPSEVIERVVAVLGAIDLDPCSNEYGGPRIPAAHHFTAADDGLSQPWRGRVYMNPPYGKEIGAWVDKLAEEFEYQNVSEAIALVPVRTDTAWWAHLPAPMVCFVTGRLTFSDHPTPAPFPSAVCYLGPNQRRFAEEFITLGLIYVRLETDAAA